MTIRPPSSPLFPYTTLFRSNDPSIILADEPTGNLDLSTGKLIIELLRQLNKERGVTIISATHDHKMLAVSDRILWIRDRKSTRLNSSHRCISYAVFCLKKKK